ncbi:MAG: hypothetical protein GC202_02885 [Alphaproteobacteria bacterium]|nr:hypothetical protein [Alphaproteobacteria bacterium]
MRRAFILAAILISGAPGAWGQDLSRTNDMHLNPKFDPVGRTPVEAAPAPEPPRPRPVYLKTKKPLNEIAQYDAKASAACRSRDFGQFEQLRGKVLADGKTYGAAAAGSDLLADHPNVGAKPPAIYLFEHQGMSGCRVWKLRPAELRAAGY